MAIFRELVFKELRDHLLSLRFEVGFLLALTLVSTSAFILSTQYQHETKEFFQRLRQEDDFLAKYAHLNRMDGLAQPHRPSSPLVLVRGLPPDAGTEMLYPNPLLELFPPVGFASAVGIVFSLLGIVLGFDAVNAEKERGTLRLVLANALPRFRVVAAKWLGGILVLVVALAAALWAAMLIVLVHAAPHWGAEDAGSLAALGVVSLLYTGVFFSLALMFSSFFSRGSVSVLASLFVWVIQVFVVPSVSPYVAAQFARVSSIAALERDLQYMTSEERDDLGRAGTQKVLEKYKGQIDLSGAAAEENKHRIATDPDFRRLYEQANREIQVVWTEVNRTQQGRANRMLEAWQAQARRQLQLSQALSYASPFPPYFFAATELSLTGFHSREQFEQQAKAYKESLWKYLWDRYHEEERKNPSYNENDFLDVSTRPRFQYVPPIFSARLAEVLPLAAMLAAWNLAFFTLAVLGFLRFDVR